MYFFLLVTQSIKLKSRRVHNFVVFYVNCKIYKLQLVDTYLTTNFTFYNLLFSKYNYSVISQSFLQGVSKRTFGSYFQTPSFDYIPTWFSCLKHSVEKNYYFFLSRERIISLLYLSSTLWYLYFKLYHHLIFLILTCTWINNWFFYIIYISIVFLNSLWIIIFLYTNNL